MVQAVQPSADTYSVARLEWEKAAGRQRVRAAGGGEWLDLPERRFARHRHMWGDWVKAALVQQWSRQCRSCSALQTRSTPPGPRRAPGGLPGASKDKATKDNLVIRSAAGVPTVDQRDATRQARLAARAGEKRSALGVDRSRLAVTPLPFEGAALAVSGADISRPAGVARRGWLVAGPLRLSCGSCGTEFRALSRAGGDFVVVCGGCRRAWGSKDCEDDVASAARAAVKRLEQR